MSCSEENLAVGGASFLIICLGTSDGVRPLLLLRSCFVRGAQSTLKDLNLDTSASWLKRMQTSPLTFYTAGASELLLRLESFLFLNSVLLSGGNSILAVESSIFMKVSPIVPPSA